MTDSNYDLLVIGSGPGGEGASIKAAKSGLRVAVVEQHTQVGGGCTHWGTIPSKMFIHVTHQANEFRNNSLFAKEGLHVRLSFSDVIHQVEDIVMTQVKERRGFYDRNGIDILEGRARFVDPHTIEVTSSEGMVRTYAAPQVVLAMGSRPYRPSDVDFAHPRVCDSDTILRLAENPHSVTIYGAGVIGCEYASAFRSLGTKVNLINVRDRLLSFLDDEISDALSYHLREQGVLIRHHEEYERVETLDDGVVLHLATGKKIKSDILLWANGRTGNSHDMNLEGVGLMPDFRGNLPVGTDFRTALPHVFAVGDVIGYPSLASVAYDQGRIVGALAAEGSCAYTLAENIPTGIYTSPEIAAIGKTERELTNEKIPYEVGHAYFRNLARAQITGHTVGVLKLLFHREDYRLLGIHCFGHQASEIVHIGQAIMSQTGSGNSIHFFAQTTFNYPTMAEAYRVAALNGLNRLF